ncbi:MAG TPA: V-type ATP synthase subunit E family protein [Thermoplasmata archaeon]|nr:V-type ATP synthase subunit E family protein [Thermoplasmata archaeon]
MSLEALVEEIRRRGEAELQATLASQQAEAERITKERDQKVAEIRATSARLTDLEVAREKAQRLAAAKLQARKMLYEARERRLEEGLQETRDLLSGFVASAAYPAVLKRMAEAATAALGKQVRLSGRAEDAAALSKVAGKSFDPTARPILGGLIAETPDGSRRLNLSFDELLRLREDQVRELLA